MKRTFKACAAALAAVTLICSTSSAVYADRIKTVDGLSYRYSESGEQKGLYTGWTKTSKGKRYYKNGVMYKNRYIKTKKGRRYYAGYDGYIVTGWYRMNGKWHYFGTDGAETVRDISVGGYTYSFSSSGEWDGISGLDNGTAMYAIGQKMSESIYGGIYNDGGIITVLATDVDAARKTINELYPENIEFIVRPCRFTYKYLTEVWQKINDSRSKFGVTAVIDRKNNLVVLTADDPGAVRTEEFTDFISENGFESCVAPVEDLDEDD